jgi:hypothetical protein
MANIFKQAALALGRFTGLSRKPDAHEPMVTLIEPVQGLDATDAFADSDAAFSDSTDAVERSAADLPPLDAPAVAWGEALGLSAQPGQVAAQADAEAIAAGELGVASIDTLSATPLVVAEQPLNLEPVDAPAIAAADVAAVAAVAAPAPAVVEAVKEEIKEAVKAPIELKPERPAKPTVSFTQMYELISGEVNKRTDASIAAYERLLAVTHDELDAARKANRIAWSVGGVMTAVAAFGAIWAAGEVSATNVEVGNLRQQVVAGQQASLERDQLRASLGLAREASAKTEVDALKTRLDQALAVSADRDRLRAAEYETLRKAKQEVESELRLARVAATTQPVSLAQPAASKVLADRTASEKPVGSERPDVWSTLLNGKDDH